MERSNKHLFKTICCIVLALTLVAGMLDIAPVRSKAASTSMKAVYTVKQLKKAMKAKNAATIIFRTVSVDPVTIPSVKKAKNKELIINAPNSSIKNKSKFKTITVNEVKDYTEAVSGNTIVWNDIYNDGLTIAKGKSVEKVTFTSWLGFDPTYRVRKGAKIKCVVFESLDKNIGIADAKNSSFSIEGQASSLELGDYYKATYTFDKSLRIIKSEIDSAYQGEYVMTYKYDKNGNPVKITNTQPGDVTSTTTRKYDSNNTLLEIKSADNSGEISSVHYEYDKEGRMVYYAVRYPDGYDMYNIEFKYDSKGRRVEEYQTPYDIRNKYTYDSAGRYIESTYDAKGYVIVTQYYYDKNGLLVKTVEESSENPTTVNEYVYDFLGNKTFGVYKNVDKNGYTINSSRFGYMLNEYVGDSPVYEDGFYSPVIAVSYAKEFYEEAGFKYVTSTEELIEAISPGAGIIIAPGSYNLSEYIEQQEMSTFNEKHKYVQLNDCFDGFELVVNDVDDLMISGGSVYAEDTYLVIDPRYSAVFRFEDCDGLQLNSFTCGHTDRGSCEGNVIDLYNCKDVGIYGMDIFGCGVYGIGAYNGSKDIRVFNSVIHDCEYGFFIFSKDVGKVTFTNCIFNGSHGGVTIYSDEEVTPDLTFNKCSFGEGETNMLAFEEKFNFNDCLVSEITMYPEYCD